MTENGPRIAYIETEQASKNIQQYYEKAEKALGSVPNVVKLLGHSEGAVAGLADVLSAYFTKLTISNRLREIAYLTATNVNDCDYCSAHHRKLALEAGLEEDQLNLLNDKGVNSDVFDEVDQAIIRFALETTREVEASDEAFEALKEHLDEQQISEIVFVVASANFIQRIGKNLKVTMEE